MPDPAANVRRYYELVDAGDIQGLIELFAPDAEYRRPGYEPLVGRDELRRFYTRDRVIDRGRHEIEALLTGADGIAVRGRFTGTLRDGSTAEAGFADFFTPTEEGLFAQRITYFYSPLV